MDPSTTFYQALTSTSFMLLGIWVAVMQVAHGGWRTDPRRHATTLHVTLKFFLPGTLGLVSLLGSAGNGGLIWRSTFVLGGLVGLADPVLYLLIVTVAFLLAGTLAVTPLQAEGMATGLVFVTGLVAVWSALLERTPVTDAASEAATGLLTATEPVEPGLYTHQHVPGHVPSRRARTPVVRTSPPPAPPSRRGSPAA